MIALFQEDNFHLLFSRILQSLFALEGATREQIKQTTLNFHKEFGAQKC